MDHSVELKFWCLRTLTRPLKVLVDLHACYFFRRRFSSKVKIVANQLAKFNKLRKVAKIQAFMLSFAGPSLEAMLIIHWGGNEG